MPSKILRTCLLCLLVQIAFITENTRLLASPAQEYWQAKALLSAGNLQQASDKFLTIYNYYPQASIAPYALYQHIMLQTNPNIILVALVHLKINYPQFPIGDVVLLRIGEIHQV